MTELESVILNTNTHREKQQNIKLMSEQWHSLPNRLVSQNKTSTEIHYTNTKAIEKEISFTGKYIQGCCQ